MTIGIDADGVLFDYIRTCAKYVNAVTGYNRASYETATKFDNLEAWQASHLKNAVDYYFSSGRVVEDMPVISGAKQFIECVRDITCDDFIIITACPGSWHEQREYALLNHFNIPRKKVHFSHDKSIFKIDLLVDDWHMNLKDLDGWRVLLDRPWNQNTDGIAVQRCYSYLDVLGEIQRIVNWNNR